ncbi:MAG: winged helix-turn-helix domain-containing protein [Nitrospirota bacterium]
MSTRKIVIGGLRLSAPDRTVQRGRRKIRLTPREFVLLWTLASSPGKLFRRRELMDAFHIAGAPPSPRVIDAHIARIRKKLRALGGDPSLIATVWCVGYKLRD